MNRRETLVALGSSLALWARPVWAGQQRGGVEFLHGVASGDPGEDRLVLWTRLTPTADLELQTCKWEIWPTSGRGRQLTGSVVTGPGRDFTVKVDVQGLEPGHDYFYQFGCGEVKSVVGRTRTLAASGLQPATLAVTSCALYPAGFFNVYAAIAQLEKLDAVLHLGDYIYEYGGRVGDPAMTAGARLGRVPEPVHPLVDLADYRQRFSQYRLEPELQAAHARAPWICVWDDHEFANNANRYGAQNHNAQTEGSWASRRDAARQAYFEWLPIREIPAEQDPFAIQRSFKFGDLASLVVMETRMAAKSASLDPYEDILRDEQTGLPTDSTVDRFVSQWRDSKREMLGGSQEHWLQAHLAKSTAAGTRWQLVGSPVLMAKAGLPDLSSLLTPSAWAEFTARLPEAFRSRLEFFQTLGAYDFPYNWDNWSGFPAARDRALDAFRASGRQPLVLSADSHMFWMNDLIDGAGHKCATEFSTSSVTSPSIVEQLGIPGLSQAFVEHNEEVRFNDAASRGFMVVKLEAERAIVEMVAVDSILVREYSLSNIQSYEVDRLGNVSELGAGGHS